MSYKTLLVNAAPSGRSQQVIAYASRLAAAQQAHLVGLASTGLSELVYQYNAAVPGMMLLPEDVSALTGNAQQALDRFQAVAGGLGVSSIEPRLTDDNLLESLVLQSRYSDLVVVGQGEFGVNYPFSAFSPQQLVLHCPRPVVIVPAEGEFRHVAERPLLAWDGGMAACRAIEAALPLLRAAKLVTLAVFNPDEVYGAHGPQPGADMAHFLARHGVRVEVVVREAGDEVGEGLLALAREREADLLVMGCYGHTRFRELLLGGASRSVLRKMHLPVLMAR
ncbi:Universal stress protein family protein [Duganella sp. CF402]|uniref:universal stress protein n=1 Tax=unclassified Duganella TaxID=2636909 RepID=UPI0008D1DA51|nr:MULTISPECIES: universal stress protein [unclassified Duganella]RZT11040.1 universal stress protein family protein [Duganella sp. BK701]SEK84386.1 Universal stress protein family protein [Duganella sp. CF402]